MIAERKTRTTPSVAVVMPAHNSAEFIRESICSVIAQTSEGWELIVVNDCSTDATCSIVEKLAASDSRIRLLHSGALLGPAGARNIGMENTSAPFIAFLDADDTLSPNSIELRRNLLEQDPLAIGAFSRQVFVNTMGRAVHEPLNSPRTVRFTDLHQNRFATSMIMIRNAGAQALFDPSLKHGEDWDLWLRLSRSLGYFRGEPRTRVYRRLHRGSVSHSDVFRDFNERLDVLGRAWQVDPRIQGGIPAYRDGLGAAMVAEGTSLRAWGLLVTALYMRDCETARRFADRLDIPLLATLPSHVLSEAAREALRFQTADHKVDDARVVRNICENALDILPEDTVRAAGRLFNREGPLQRLAAPPSAMLSIERDYFESVLRDRKAANETLSGQTDAMAGLIECFVRQKWQLLAHEGITRVYLMGFGMHTKWLIEAVEGVPGPEIVAILDDNAPSQPTSHPGVPVIDAAMGDPNRVDAVILSSDVIQPVLAHRCRKLFMASVVLIDLYEKLDMEGPYPKRIAGNTHERHHNSSVHT